jgi:mycothiol synthase
VISVDQLKLRGFRGQSDYAPMAAALNSSESADRIERNVTADDLANAYQHLSNCDPYRDIAFAEVAGEVIGYVRGWWSEETLTRRLYLHNGFLVPEWRRKGVGRVMLVWMEKRLHEIAAEHPHALEKYFQVDVKQTQKGKARLLENSGYQPIRFFYQMVRASLDNLPEFPLPEGVEIRPVTPEHYGAIWGSVDETSQDEWGYQQPTEDDYQEWLTSDHFQPDLWQVAWDTADNRVVGHVLTFINDEENRQLGRKRGYTEGIGVDRSWRRRGLARTLIVRSLQAQKAAGMSESALAADSDSASNVTRLYESCGFRVVSRDAIYRKRM